MKKKHKFLKVFLKSVMFPVGFSLALAGCCLPWQVRNTFLNSIAKPACEMMLYSGVFIDFFLEEGFSDESSDKHKSRRRGLLKNPKFYKHRNEESSVLFSGGSDSTLVAAWCCQRFKRVHLLTFRHSGMTRLDKCAKNVKRLQKIFGEDKVVHMVIDIENVFKNLYFGSYLKDFMKVGVFLCGTTFNICQLAMHTQTILYNLENKIFHTFDGYKSEKKHVYIVMSPEGKKLLRSFYERYGMRYYNPVYDIPRTDWELFRIGITSKKNIKFPYERLNYSAQHSCSHGLLVNAYLLGYWYVFHCKMSERWFDHFKDKIYEAVKYVEKNRSKTSVHHGPVSA